MDDFKPWRKQAIFGVVLLGAAGLTTWAIFPAFQQHPQAGLFALATGTIGFGLINRARIRWMGKRIEAKAFSTLKLPAGWSAVHSQVVPGLGDADILITDPADRRYVIEVKSNRVVEIRTTLFLRREIFGAQSKPLSHHEAQVLRLAEPLGAIPVLYYPEGSRPIRSKLSSGVLVAAGNRRQLMIQIGAKSIFSLW